MMRKYFIFKKIIIIKHKKKKVKGKNSIKGITWKRNDLNY